MLKVLVIEDDANISDFVKRGLSQKGYDVDVAETGLQGLEKAKSSMPDLVVLDLILPDIDGIDVCRELRALGDIGIIILSARQLVGDRVLGLEAGADDYVPKPFAFEELAARVRSVLRRKQRAGKDIIKIMDLEIDTRCRKVTRGNRTIELTYREFELLKLLAENENRPMRREVILSRIWGDDYEADSDPVKVYINSIRAKINKDQGPDLIHTLRGFGYVLREEL